MDPETQTLQEHGCRTPVSLAQKSFSWQVETMLSDRHSIPELNLQKYNLRCSPHSTCIDEYVKNTGKKRTRIPTLEMLGLQIERKHT